MKQRGERPEDRKQRNSMKILYLHLLPEHYEMQYYSIALSEKSIWFQHKDKCMRRRTDRS